jgi:predicted ATPase
MVGRIDCIQELSAQLATSRFVTIVGSGGVGKTTVAIAVAHNLLEAFSGAVVFADLGTVEDADMVISALASALGLSVASRDPQPNLVAFLRDKRMLLILDNCEHVIEAAAVLTEELFLAAPQVHILATSREVLRVEGENVFRSPPLAFPPEDPGLTATAALSFPAASLFAERAAAAGIRLDLDGPDAAIVASVCRKLDGIPLAIELAAGHVGAYGLQQTSALLDQRLDLLWKGRRTVTPRQQTLRATLDWSYELLSDLERVVLRRLAVFVGYFSLEAALAIIIDATVEQASLIRAMGSLVAKSMITMEPFGATMRYRLLETTRAYALETDADAIEVAGLRKRHADYYRLWLERTGAEWPALSNTERSTGLASLGNVRAALHWCFGPNGSSQLGIALAAAAAPVYLAMSLLTSVNAGRKGRSLPLTKRHGAAPRRCVFKLHLQCLRCSPRETPAKFAMH